METPDSWIERNTYDPQPGRDYEAPEPEDEEDFMPTKPTPPNASLRQKQARSRSLKPWVGGQSNDEPMFLLRSFMFRRGNGDVVNLGVCPLCGRNVTQSSCNKTGGRCRYDGAQFDSTGRMVNKPWEPSQPPHAHGRFL